MYDVDYYTFFILKMMGTFTISHCVCGIYRLVSLPYHWYKQTSNTHFSHTLSVLYFFLIFSTFNTIYKIRLWFANYFQSGWGWGWAWADQTFLEKTWTIFSTHKIFKSKFREWPPYVHVFQAPPKNFQNNIYIYSYFPNFYLLMWLHHDYQPQTHVRLLITY